MPRMAFLRRGKDDAALMLDPSPAAVHTGLDTSPSGALAASADRDANTMKKTARQNVAVLLGRCNTILDALQKIAADVKRLKCEIKEAHGGYE
ncbi:hypothetical protein EI94DRAFT_1818606 [Lactarius quietus]|nr:hypothetical protein EI94DRAFT_1818606 [Lactarius quietus]